MNSAATRAFRNAIEAAKRNEEALSGVRVALERFSASVDVASREQHQLVVDLVRALGVVDDEGNEVTTVHDLRARVEELEARLANVHQTAKEEQERWLEEQDRFIEGLIDEHESEVMSLQTRLAELETLQRQSGPAPSSQSAEQTVHELRRQLNAWRDERERARELVQRMRDQRDRAQRRVRDFEKSLAAEAPPDTYRAPVGARRTSPISERETAAPRAAEPRAAEPRAAEPRAAEPRAAEPRTTMQSQVGRIVQQRATGDVSNYPTTPAPPSFEANDEGEGIHVPRQAPPPAELMGAVLQASGNRSSRGG